LLGIAAAIGEHDFHLMPGSIVMLCCKALCVLRIPSGRTAEALALRAMKVHVRSQRSPGVPEVGFLPVCSTYFGYGLPAGRVTSTRATCHRGISVCPRVFAKEFHRRGRSVPTGLRCDRCIFLNTPFIRMSCAVAWPRAVFVRSFGTARFRFCAFAISAHHGTGDRDAYGLPRPSRPSRSDRNRQAHSALCAISA
jgi:hypothetical protein